MFDALTESLESTLKSLRGQGRLTEENVSASLREVRRAFLAADVNFNVTRDFVQAVKEKALGQNVLTAVSPGQMIVKIIHDELVEIMGGKAKEVFACWKATRWHNDGWIAGFWKNNLRRQARSFIFRSKKEKKAFC